MRAGAGRGRGAAGGGDVRSSRQIDRYGVVSDAVLLVVVVWRVAMDVGLNVSRLVGQV
jgi:hypothetical protein